MKKIKELQEKESGTLPLLVKACSKGTTSKGAPYLNLTLQDGSGSIDGKLWDAKPKDEEAAIVGHVENITYEVLEYNKTLQLRVNKIEDLDQSTIALSDYVMAGKYTRQELEKQVADLVASIQNKNLQTLVQGMMDKVGEKYYQYPAASRIHHNFLGGLAEHTLGMAMIAEDICKRYPQLNRDLLISGVLIHDMGKTAELGGLFAADYTEEGKLAGHISIGHGWLMEVASNKKIENSEEAILLRHMILSHHGHYEYGSPVLPQIPEAEVLFLIDNLDARMNTLKQALENVKPGEYTQKIMALENRRFYKSKL